MPRTSQNTNLRKAAAAKVDEFYTQLSDIEHELENYEHHFAGKVVLCNCDDPSVSNFFRYFSLSFEQLKLKRLITTCYKNQNPDIFSPHDKERAVYLIYDGDKSGNRVPDPDEIGKTKLKGNGDFRSPECVELLKQADIVVTNPPFSLFREYVALLMQYKKKFLILGSMNAISYREIFPLIKENKLWIGVNNGPKKFEMPKDAANYNEIMGGVKLKSMGNVWWYTNLDNAKRHERLFLHKSYNSDNYPKYDNYDAINVDKITDIPADYNGLMGVPISFMNKYNPDQFDIIDGIGRYSVLDGPTAKTRGKFLSMIDGKPKYLRILIRNKQVQK